jgi:hypothetical protein
MKKVGLKWRCVQKCVQTTSASASARSSAFFGAIANPAYENSIRGVRTRMLPTTTVEMESRPSRICLPTSAVPEKSVTQCVVGLTPEIQHAPPSQRHGEWASWRIYD